MEKLHLISKSLYIKIANFILFFILIYTSTCYSQQGFLVTPQGVLDKVFDDRGQQYTLSDLLINNSVSSGSRSVLVTCSTSSIFNLYFEPGCGMEDTANATHNARRDVVCKVFQDLSAFINTPLTTTGNKVNIWIRNMNNIPNTSTNLVGLGSSFYNLPSSTLIGGIADNEIWKTIHTGIDSYANVTAPLITSGTSSNASGIFYHGYMAFNFSTYTWNTNTGIANTAGNYDLYSVVLHEMMHALGINTLINENGTSRFNSANFQYFSRYDQYLKLNDALTPLLTVPSLTPMFNNVFNGNNSVLRPGCTIIGNVNNGNSLDNTICNQAIKFVGSSTTGIIPVYTPTCYERGSSLSHFEDQCYGTTPGNNTYFAMCNAGGTGVTRRFIKPEERFALCDIGYSVKPTYGVSGARINGTSTSYSYGGTTSCSGITVAGVNDGLNINGTYTFTGNIGTNIIISGSTILANDINATGGFESLQDITTNTMLSTGGTIATNVILNSTVPGIHLLRYIPINGNQRGNITYVYVFLRDSTLACPAEPSVCDFVINGNFEQLQPFATLPAIDDVNLYCGWSNASGTVDRFMNTLTTPPSNQFICNNFGSQTETIPGNRGYIGFLNNSFPDYMTHEIVKTRLKTPLTAGTYRLSFDVSLAETYSRYGITMQAFLSPLDLNFASSVDLPIAPGTFLINPSSTTNFNTWERVTFNFTATGAEEYLYLGGLRNVTYTPNIPANSVANCYDVSTLQNPAFISYNYLDNVSLVQIDGATLNLPASICLNQTIPNLTTFLSAVPTDGYFTGNGVVLANGIYSFNPALAGAGTTTINYNYTNNLGCLVTLTDTIVVTNNAVITTTFSFATTICSGAVAPVLPTISTNGITGTWNPATVSNTVSGTYVFTPNLGQCATVFTANVVVNSFPVITTTTPASQTVCLNSSAIPLQVNVAGTGITYQWFRNSSNSTSGGTLLTGAINSNFSPPTNVVGTRYYYVVVKNGTCQSTSSVFTIIVTNGVANAGTLTGTQNLCRTGRSLPTTVFTASVSGGTWSSSNTAIATILSTTATTATILVAPGTATITYTITGPSGCTSSVTRTVTTTMAVMPTFSQFPVNPTIGVSDPYILCSGAAPVSLPTTSSNGITGIWDPTSINNTLSGGYVFTPNAGQCARSIYQSVVVINNNDIVANNDIFTVLFPSSTIVTNSVVNNDTYMGSPLNLVTFNLSYTVSPVGILPTYTQGGVTFNSNGTFTIQPNTTPGTYIYNYRLTTNCGNTNTASATLVINNFVSHPGKVSFTFCFDGGSNQYTTQSLNSSTSLYDNATIGGLPATANNSTIIAPIIPGIVINANGTLTISSSLPLHIEFFYRIRSNLTGQLSNDIRCDITIQSPIIAFPDTFSYNTSGAPIGGSSFNVLSNDTFRQCAGGSTYTLVPLTLSIATLTGGATTPPYFRVEPNGSIFFNTNAGPNPGTVPVGTYPLTYTVCLVNNTAVCVTQTVTIIVTNSSRIAADNPKPIVKQKINTLTKQSTYQIINFPDANLKAKLLSPLTCANLTNTGNVMVDLNLDGEIDTNEALQIGGVNLINSNISNLIGLEYFTNLISIALGINNISNFDLNLPNLAILSIQNNPLTNFNTQNLPNLTRFNCSNTLLTSINTTNKYLLEIVSLSDTQINTIDLGICPNLIYFYCQNNPNLTSINIKNTSSLDYNNSFMQQDCWRNCPNLNYICTDSNEIPMLQSFLGNCGVNTSGITIDSACALGVDDVLLDGISIAPNPSTGIFEITFPTSLTVKTTATVYTMLGQKMMSINEVGNSTMQVDLSGYPNGTYLLQLVLDDKKVIKKLIKR